MDREMRRETIKIVQSMLTKQNANGGGLVGSALHRVSGLSIAGSATIPSTTTAASYLCVMLAIMQVNLSGIFDVKITGAVTGITSGDSVDYLVSADSALVSAVPVVTGGTAFGSAPANDGSAVATRMFTNNATVGGITYTNGVVGAPGHTMFDTGAQVAVTTALNQMFSFDMSVGSALVAASGAITPFTKGQLALIGLYTKLNAATVTWQGLTVDISERYV
jgi:hypothetical protein